MAFVRAPAKVEEHVRAAETVEVNCKNVIVRVQFADDRIPTDIGIRAQPAIMDQKKDWATNTTGLHEIGFEASATNAVSPPGHLHFVTTLNIRRRCFVALL